MYHRRCRFDYRSRTEKVAVDATRYVAVDSFLKKLKNHSRQLNETLSTLQADLRVLERIYYKGKNQHRSALFWRRVPELRRLGRRMIVVGVETLLAELRLSCFPQEARQNSRILRGSWTHIPDHSFLRTSTQSLSSIAFLAQTGRERVEDAFRMFSSTIAHGTFLQLLLALSAIAARLRAIFDGMREIVENCSCLCDALYIELFEIPKPPTVANVQMSEDDGEDFGRTVRRGHQSPTPDPHDSTATVLAAQSTIFPQSVTPTAEQRVVATKLEGKKKVKKKRPKDEIDEIFGL